MKASTVKSVFTYSKTKMYKTVILDHIDIAVA